MGGGSRAVWAITAMTLVAGNFAPPAEGPVAFRRDKIPLDADAMAGLSRQLETLAQGLNAGNRSRAPGRRADARARPGAGPRERQGAGTARGYQNGSHQPAADAAQLEKSRARIWQYITWLETPEAGSHGQALAACLTDVLVISDPEHPKAKTLTAAGERGAWKGWIPDLAAYEAPAIVEAAAPEEAVAAKTVDHSPGILLKKAKVSALLWKETRQGRAVEMGAGTRAASDVRRGAGWTGQRGPRPFVISINLSPEEGRYRRVTGVLLALLKKQYGNLPSGVRVRISSPGLANISESPGPQSISAAAAVLAGAAVSGIEPDATILGLVDETGAFTLPTGFWNQLQSLGPGDGGRLILPAAAAEYLPSMLALEMPQLFFDYEVLLAADFPDWSALPPKTPMRRSRNSWGASGKSATRPISSPSANTSPTALSAGAWWKSCRSAFHASAKMLAIQGAGNVRLSFPSGSSPPNSGAPSNHGVARQGRWRGNRSLGHRPRQHRR